MSFFPFALIPTPASYAKKTAAQRREEKGSREIAPSSIVRGPEKRKKMGKGDFFLATLLALSLFSSSCLQLLFLKWVARRTRRRRGRGEGPSPHLSLNGGARRRRRRRTWRHGGGGGPRRHHAQLLRKMEEEREEPEKKEGRKKRRTGDGALPASSSSSSLLVPGPFPLAFTAIIHLVKNMSS